MLFSDVLSVRFVSDVQFPKAQYSTVLVQLLGPPIVSTPVPMSISPRDVHPSNAPRPIVFTESGMRRVFKDVQSMNAAAPMDVSELGNATDSNAVQASNTR